MNPSYVDAVYTGIFAGLGHNLGSARSHVPPGTPAQHGGDGLSAATAQLLESGSFEEGTLPWALAYPVSTAGKFVLNAEWYQPLQYVNACGLLLTRLSERGIKIKVRWAGPRSVGLTFARATEGDMLKLAGNDFLAMLQQGCIRLIRPRLP